MLGTLLLLIFAPVMALVSLAVALESPGPVLFCQKRTGRGGKTFPIFKFRSMRVMEDGAEVRQAVEGDARITRVGRIIRKLSLDELPQLFNVIAGQMSLVGPAPPCRGCMTTIMAPRISNYALRSAGQAGHHRLGPGERRARRHAHHRDHAAGASTLDAWYVANHSLALDLKILVAHAAGSPVAPGTPTDARGLFPFPPQYEAHTRRCPAGRQ